MNVRRTPPPTPLRFRLIATKRALRFERGAWVIDMERDAQLGDEPRGFRPMEGNGAMVGAHASKLNEIQIRAGRLDYLYSADVIVP